MAEHDSRQLITGWEGRIFDELRVGDIYKHPFGRTVTETDDVWSATIAMNRNPLHFNDAYAAETEFGERIANGAFVLALSVGMDVIDVTMNATAVLGYDDVQFHAPVFYGDTIYAESEVLEKRRSESRDNVGFVTTELRTYNANGELVLSLEQTSMILTGSDGSRTAAQPLGWPPDVGTQPADVREKDVTET